MNTFADIYGYDKIKEHLQNAIKLNKVSHAYIFNGSLGAGKAGMPGGGVLLRRHLGRSFAALRAL